MNTHVPYYWWQGCQTEVLPEPEKNRVKGDISTISAATCRLVSDRINPTATLCEGYGITECSPLVSINRVENVRPGTIGKVMLKNGGLSPLHNIRIMLSINMVASQAEITRIRKIGEND